MQFFPLNTLLQACHIQSAIIRDDGLEVIKKLEESEATAAKITTAKRQVNTKLKAISEGYALLLADHKDPAALSAKLLKLIKPTLDEIKDGNFGYLDMPLDLHI